MASWQVVLRHPAGTNNLTVHASKALHWRGGGALLPKDLVDREGNMTRIGFCDFVPARIRTGLLSVEVEPVDIVVVRANHWIESNIPSTSSTLRPCCCRGVMRSQKTANTTNRRRRQPRG